MPDFRQRGRQAYRRGEQLAAILDPLVVEAINALTLDERRAGGDKAILTAWAQGWSAARAADEPRDTSAREDAPHLTLTHRPAEGSLLHGTRRGDAAGPALNSVRHVAVWRWSTSLGSWYIPRSRDRAARYYQLDTTAAALRAAGFTVSIEIGDERRSIAEQETDRAHRAAARAEHLTDRAERLRTAGEAGWAAARSLAARIPTGQPILVGHHSEARHRRDLAKIDRMEDRAVAQLQGSEEATRRAEAATSTQSHREHGATTARRIDRLEADLRRAQRGLARADQAADAEQRARTRAHWEPIIEGLDEQLSYWRPYLQGLIDAGLYTAWGPEHFARGDYVVHRWGVSEVKRVNKRSLTIPHLHDVLAGGGDTTALPYDLVQGRRSAAEGAAILAQASTPTGRRAQP